MAGPGEVDVGELTGWTGVDAPVVLGGGSSGASGVMTTGFGRVASVSVPGGRPPGVWADMMTDVGADEAGEVSIFGVAGSSGGSVTGFGLGEVGGVSALGFG